MNLVTIQNAFVSWSLAPLEDTITGLGSAAYLKASIILCYFKFFSSSLEPLAYWFKAISKYQYTLCHREYQSNTIFFLEVFYICSSFSVSTLELLGLLCKSCCLCAEHSKVMSATALASATQQFSAAEVDTA